MAFPITLPNVEVRSIAEGDSKKTGNHWMSLLVEDLEDSKQLRISIPEDAQKGVKGLGLGRGEVITVSAKLNVGDGYCYVQWVGLVARGDTSELDY